MNTIQLADIGQIALTVRDVERAKAFYRETLGMTFLFDTGSMAFFECGAVRLMLGLAEDARPVGGTILYYRVVEIEKVCVEFERRGVEFIQSAHIVAKMRDHVLWMAFLKDSEGNVLGLMEEVGIGPAA